MLVCCCFLGAGNVLSESRNGGNPTRPTCQDRILSVSYIWRSESDICTNRDEVWKQYSTIQPQMSTGCCSRSEVDSETGHLQTACSTVDSIPRLTSAGVCLRENTSEGKRCFFSAGLQWRAGWEGQLSVQLSVKSRSSIKKVVWSPIYAIQIVIRHLGVASMQNHESAWTQHTFRLLLFVF